MVFEWFSDAYWHWRNVFYFRFSEYNDDIDRCAFFCEICNGWIQMNEDDYVMSLSNFDPYNLSGRDPYYTYMMNKND